MIKTEMIVPTTQYGNIKFIGTVKDLPEMEKLQLRYAERPLKWTDGVFEKITTFTGEEILYCAETHTYTDLEGRKLIGGSTYAKQFETPFDRDRIAQAYAVKNSMAVQDVIDIWENNGKLSRLLGTTLHVAMENYFRHRGQPAYNLPKSPFLASAVSSCEIGDCVAYPEIMVSDVKNRRVGQIDLLVETTQEAKGVRSGYLVDWKTDFSIKKNLKKHYNQLSYYAHILASAGWDITRVEVHNFVEKKWEIYQSEVLNIKE